MRTFSEVYAALRRQNRGHYRMLTGCSFFSVLLITAYVTMMRSPTVLTVLPEGGDSRKQVMMVFVLACVGCAVFTLYASSIFFRQKSRETGVFLLLGASKKQIRALLFADLARISFGSCIAGAVLGAPLAWLIWRVFRLVVVDSKEMVLTFDPMAGLFALCFSVFVIVMLFVMGVRFLKRTNIIDIVNESHKTEPIREVKSWYGSVGILLMIVGGLLGYLAPVFCVRVLQWYPPAIVSGICYAPLFVGLYMLLLHTVVNGWRQGKSRYKHIITTSIMKFQGRQTVRNMLVITVLIAGAYFASFYTPMLGTGAVMGYAERPIDYAYHYRADQNMVTESEVREMAKEEGVTITSWVEAEGAELGMDGTTQIETESPVGTTYTTEYVEMLSSKIVLSERTYNALTGQQIDVQPGHIRAVCDDNGDNQYMFDPDVTRLTNLVTGEVMHVIPDSDAPLCYTMLFGRYVLDDGDYKTITRGLDERKWFDHIVFFNVADCDESYAFAKRLFYAIVDHSGPEVEVVDAYNIGSEQYHQSMGEEYHMLPENMAKYGIPPIDYDQRDSSDFRLYWKYMPQFRVLDQNEFVRTMAVFLMLFIFIAIICFAAVIVIAYTRCLTIALANKQLYEDLRHLGASRDYLFRTVRGQVSRVFVTPCIVGTTGIFALYAMIMYLNDNRFTFQELVGMAACLIVVMVGTLVIYGVYRSARKQVCNLLGI